MTEKNAKLSDLNWVHFDGVAMDLEKEEFKYFVIDIRKVELMTGPIFKKFTSKNIINPSK